MARACPDAALQPYVETLWVSAGEAARAPREHSLPSGAMHLAIRLDAPLRLYAGSADTVGHEVSQAVIGGVRMGHCIKDTSTPGRSVGAVLRPGAARALFGCSAAELAGRHLPLDQVWGSEAGLLLERLQAEADPSRQLDLFAAALRARLRPVGALHPQIAQALHDLARAGSVADAVAASGHSHRHFIARFREATGLPPKAYARLRRFRRALRMLARGGALAEVAFAAGYSDQAHFSREFRELSGVTPRAYRAARPDAAHHLPVGAVR
ncbi:helix-turn-helix domain-containing protein [Marilutibacter alkalisoli]|uniref:Helix-turn-helix transcriptional regulator n=1 Tax=Marilutibacter alkalisoli TaxID=2591633 RepID=A0A514BTN5_9GAMM|nr:AraC family transcriptional regulator [Lysobacter alkalisoli]QDH70753.1 helix-turn-helix transcriptional regulator [Lysobacter alkalisoli]